MANYEIKPDNVPPNLEPDENITLWRYMSFSSLCEIMIKDCIPLISIHNYPDKSEGAVLREVLSKLPNTNTNGIEFAMQQASKYVYISSWHKSENENAAMWDRYTHGADGVAIKTNAKLLLDCIKDSNPEFVSGPGYSTTIDQSSPNEIVINPIYAVREVEYTSRDPSEFEMQAEYFDIGMEKMCYLYKFMDFQDEAEVRILHSTIGNMYDFATRDSPAIPNSESQPLNSLPLRIGSASKLIQQIVISPHAHGQFIETVKKVVAHLGISRDVLKNITHPITHSFGFEIVESRRKEWV